jgi:hypothetical protein
MVAPQTISHNVGGKEKHGHSGMADDLLLALLRLND